MAFLSPAQYAAIADALSAQSAAATIASASGRVIAGLLTATGRVLARFCPADAERSRILAGIHYRFDGESGASIGERVAGAAIEGHPAMLARLLDSAVDGGHVG